MYSLCKHNSAGDVVLNKTGSQLTDRTGNRDATAGRVLGQAAEGNEVRSTTGRTPHSEEQDLQFAFLVFAMRSSIGLRPANPSSVPCQWVIDFSPSFQHNRIIRPSPGQGKSSSPLSISLT